MKLCICVVGSLWQQGRMQFQYCQNIAGLQDFNGRILHTSDYKNGDEYKGKKVLVVGCGNSGMEIILDLCNYDAQVSLVVRHEVVRGIKKFTPKGAEFMGGETKGFETVILATGNRV
ncbi:hypothetical protein POM88_046454 [Heracleum sosnowskyi]|uniref:Flavin-containing monooxygenase n=1 Tax=Heracleum sosnowskyi TaxID=360622 RepID=A0AAD8M4P9_9APIA|nr:hypothetical protein POM88_046454 [Heracleum sosnowskyi]